MNRNQLIGLGILAAFNGIVFWAAGSIGITLTSAAIAVMSMFVSNVYEAYGQLGMIFYICAIVAVFLGGIVATAIFIKRLMII